MLIALASLVKYFFVFSTGFEIPKMYPTSSSVSILITSAEVIKMLTELEVGYIFGISNPVENTKKYFTNEAKAINMGVYGADLSYATLYNIQQSVLDYLSAIRSMSADL